MSVINNKYYYASKSSHKIGKITFWNLHFSPNKLDKSDYIDLKNRLNIRQNLNWFPKNDFWVFYNQELILFGICIILLVLNKFKFADWIFGITLIVNLFGAYVLFLFLADVKEYFEYSTRKSAYLSQLRADILNSLNYDEFITMQKLKHPYLYK